MSKRAKSASQAPSVTRREFLKSSGLTVAIPTLAAGSPAFGMAGGQGASAVSRDNSFDVVIYGATASGVLAAIAAAKEGARVALLEPGRHLGGMVSGGLSRTDMERQENLIGGLAGEFFERVGLHYNRPWSAASTNSDDWTFEPHVAEDIFNNWIKETGPVVRFGHRVDSAEKQ